MTPSTSILTARIRDETARLARLAELLCDPERLAVAYALVHLNGADPAQLGEATDLTFREVLRVLDDLSRHGLVSLPASRPGNEYVLVDDRARRLLKVAIDLVSGHPAIET